MVNDRRRRFLFCRFGLLLLCHGGRSPLRPRPSVGNDLRVIADGVCGPQLPHPLILRTFLLLLLMHLYN